MQRGVLYGPIKQTAPLGIVQCYVPLQPLRAATIIGKLLTMSQTIAAAAAAASADNERTLKDVHSNITTRRTTQSLLLKNTMHKLHYLV